MTDQHGVMNASSSSKTGIKTRTLLHRKYYAISLLSSFEQHIDNTDRFRSTESTNSMGNSVSDSDSVHEAVLRKGPGANTEVILPERTSSLRVVPGRISSAPELLDLDIVSSTGEAAQRRRASHRISRLRTYGPELVMPFASAGMVETEVRGAEAGIRKAQKSMSWVETSRQDWRHPCEDSEDEGHDRYADLHSFNTRMLRGWDHVRSIPATAFEHLAMQYAPPGATSARATTQAEGANNLVQTIAFADSDVKYCIRVPCCGSPNLWTTAARSTLRNTVDTMRFLRSRTRMRVPAVIKCDEGFKNIIRAPFIMMRCVAGKAVQEVWWECETTEPSNDNICPSPALEMKRQNILRSVAEQVVELKKVTFDRLGTFALQDGDETQPVSVNRAMLPFVHVLCERNDVDAAHQNGKGFTLGGEDAGEVDVGSTSSCYSSSPIPDGCHTCSYENHVVQLEYWRQKLHDRRSPISDTFKLEGIFCLYTLMLECLPFAPGSKDAPAQTGILESFVLGQTDFQPQNIFVDEQGYVTGIIDWDYTDVKPRYNGWARQPLWLCTDWVPESLMSSNKQSQMWPDTGTMPVVELERYRKDYARYLIRACEKHGGGDVLTDDWKFALKNHIFDGIILAIGKPGDMERIVKRLLTTQIGDQFDWDRHLNDLGCDGFRRQPGLEQWYKNLFQKLFSCDATAVKAELGLLQDTNELQRTIQYLQQRNEVIENIDRMQKELLDVYREQIELSRKYISLLEGSRNEPRVPPEEPPKKRYREKGSYPPAPSPDVSWHSWNSKSEYLMSGALRPANQVDTNAVPSAKSDREDQGMPKLRKRSKWKLVVRWTRETVQKTWTFRWGQ